MMMAMGSLVSGFFRFRWTASILAIILLDISTWLAFSEPKTFGDYTLPSKLEMLPHNKPGHKTVIVYDHLDFDAKDVTDDQFTLRHLRSRF